MSNTTEKPSQERLDEARRRLEELGTPELQRACGELGTLEWEPWAQGLAEAILVERGECVDRTEGCPACGGELERGHLAITGTPLGFLFVGFSHKHVWFHSDSASGKRMLIGNGERPAALQCMDCGLALVHPRH